MFHNNQVFRHAYVGLCGVALIFLLAACDWGGTSASPPTPTPIPTQPPTPSPTPTAVSGLVTYKGSGYTIGYPKGWKASTGNDGFVSFSDLHGVTYVSITSQPNPQGTVSASALVDTGLQVFQSQAKNYQRLDVNTTTTLDKETWSQGAATGDITASNQTSTVTVKVFVIADNHTAHSLQTQGFVIAYGTDQQVFDLINASYFQPMLRTFRFTQ